MDVTEVGVKDIFVFFSGLNAFPAVVMFAGGEVQRAAILAALSLGFWLLGKQWVAADERR